MRSSRTVVLIGVLAVAVFAMVADAPARDSAKKGMWGPVTIAGQSQFPTYRSLGARIYSTRVRWERVAPQRPARPRDPADPAYQWPPDLDAALREANRYRMRVAVDVRNAPAWANGGHGPEWVPLKMADWRDFLTAMTRHYPGIDYWVIWAEPTRTPNFQPLAPQQDPTKRLGSSGRHSVATYARLLDTAYSVIHGSLRRAKVVGGNSFVGGDISPFNFIRHLRLPSGRRPRMDLYGHHPFSARRPDLSKGQIAPGLADFSDLDLVARWVDRYLGRNAHGRRIKLYLGEFSLASDHQSRTFNIWVTRKTQASWLRSALRIVRRWNRIEAMVWLGLYDQPPAADGLETNWGLLDWQGRPKPAFRAFQRG